MKSKSTFTFLCLLLGLLLVMGVFAGCSEQPAAAPNEGEEEVEGEEEIEAEEVARGIMMGPDGKLLPTEGGFPNMEITIWCTHPTGHTDEIEARLFAKLAEKYSPVPVITDTAGIGARLQMEHDERISTMRGGTDGHHIFVTSMSGLATRLVCRDIRPASLERFKKMTLAAKQEGPILISVRDDSPFETWEDLVEYAKENPGQLQISTSAAGSGYHIFLEMVAGSAGFEMQPVFHDGGSQAVLTMLGKGTEASSTDMGAIKGQLDAGEVRVLLQGAESRLPTLPDVPCTAELGLEGNSRLLGYTTYHDVPAENRDWLMTLIELVTAEEEYLEFLEDRGFMPLDLYGDDAAEYLDNFFWSQIPSLEKGDFIVVPPEDVLHMEDEGK